MRARETSPPARSLGVAVAHLALVLSVLCTVGCGARTALEQGDAPNDAARPMDARPDAGQDAGQDAGLRRPDAGPRPLDAGSDAGADAGPMCRGPRAGCEGVEACGDGSDGDCDGRVDEGCPCSPGEVQPCFLGPPGRRGVGACSDGAQICSMESTWGACEGGIRPSDGACTGRDDNCNGCDDETPCALDCPGPGDPRLPEGVPFRETLYDARDFYPGAFESVRWTVRGGPCDALAPNLESYELEGADEPVARLTPRLSGEYTVTLEVTAPGGEALSCSWILPVRGPGLRVEMCYPESRTQDVDLYLHRPNTRQPWFRSALDTQHIHEDAVCSWHACEPEIRGTSPSPNRPLTRVDWGYAPSPLSECEHGPLGDDWRELGFCPNPRLDIDNNLVEGIGLPENINVDAPRDGETFRVMVHNWSGTLAHPLVNVYCGGLRAATLGAAPERVEGFSGRPQNLIGDGVGAMWHVADITTRVGADGVITGCDVALLHPEGSTGYRISQNDHRFD